MPHKWSCHNNVASDGDANVCFVFVISTAEDWLGIAGTWKGRQTDVGDSYLPVACPGPRQVAHSGQLKERHPPPLKSECCPPAFSRWLRTGTWRLVPNPAVSPKNSSALSFSRSFRRSPLAPRLIRPRSKGGTIASISVGSPRNLGGACTPLSTNIVSRAAPLDQRRKKREEEGTRGRSVEVTSIIPHVRPVKTGLDILAS